MPDSFTTTQQTWLGFYEVMGESSATLTGLMFVAVTIVAPAIKVTTLPIVRAMISPVLSYFTTALVISAAMCMPMQGRSMVAVELVGGGVFGLYTLTKLFLSMRMLHRRLPMDRRTWILNAVLPTGSYLGIFTAAAGLGFHWPWALGCLGVSILSLVVTGVVNAWEITLHSMVLSPEELAAVEQDDTISQRKG